MCYRPSPNILVQKLSKALEIGKYLKVYGTEGNVII